MLDPGPEQVWASGVPEWWGWEPTAELSLPSAMYAAAAAGPRQADEPGREAAKLLGLALRRYVLRLEREAGLSWVPKINIAEVWCGAYRRAGAGSHAHVLNLRLAGH